MNTIQLRLDETQLNRRFNKLHRKLDRILTMLEDWDAPIMEAREEIRGSNITMGDVKNAMKALRKLESEIGARDEGWISSNERLPKEYESVDVLYFGKCFVSNRIDGSVWINEDESIAYHESISSTKDTYWREIQ